MTKNRILLFGSGLIFSMLAVGCAGNSKPKSAPDQPKVDANAYLRVPGCDGGKKIKDTPGPLKEYREKMFIRNMRFMDSNGHKGEKKILEQCNSVEAIDRFFGQFWGPVRDPDKATPVNEYKALIDERIADIENEIFFDDVDIPGTFFAGNGGFRGDMAWVYLLRGAPHYKLHIDHMSRVADLMAWIYFDQNQRPLYVFIFYNKGYGYQLFRNHMTMATWEAYKQTLKEIARVFPVSDEDYIAIEQELYNYDKEYVFQFGLRTFSYYEEIRIDKVLAPPTPESITAKVIQPKILGVPDIPKDMKMVFSQHHTTIPGFFTLVPGTDGNYIAKLTMPFLSVDWEDKTDIYESNFDVLISFTEQLTREKKEILFSMSVKVKPSEYDINKDKYFPVELNSLTKFSDSEDAKKMPIPDIIKTLKPGAYEVKLKVLNVRTLKSGTWFQNITIDK